MADSDILKTALLRLAAGNATDAEREIVQRALQNGQITLAAGERAVAFGGNVTDTVIVTGDGNVVHVFPGLDAETFRTILALGRIPFEKNAPFSQRSLPYSTVWSHTGESAAETAGEGSKQVQIFRALDNYLNTLLGEVEYIDSPILDVMVSLKGIPLREIFVSLQAISIAPRLKADILIRENFEQALRNINFNPESPISLAENEILDRIKGSWREIQLQAPAITVQEAISNHKALVILGHPGSGKSTLLRYLALSSLTHLPSDSSRVIPFLIRLAEISASGGLSYNLAESLDYHCSQHYGLFAANSFSSLSSQGHVLLLLDGLDEIGDIVQRTRAVLAIQRFAPSFVQAGNQIVVTSRLVGYRTHRPLGSLFEHYAIADLDPYSSHRLITSLLRELLQTLGRNLTEDELLHEVETVENIPGINTLVNRPLTATMLCALKVANKPDPHSRSDLFKQITELLEGEWELLTGRQPRFPRSLISNVLSGLAHWILGHRLSGLMTFQEADEQIIDALVTSHQATQIEAKHLSQEVLLHIRDACGIIVEKSPGLLGFSLRQFQEFYAALDFIRAGTSSWKQLNQWSYNVAYIEVIRFIIGLASLLYPGSGEMLISKLLDKDSEVGSPLHKGLMTTLYCLPEIYNPSHDLVIAVSTAISKILFDCTTFPYDREFYDEKEEVVYRATMFSSFRNELAKAFLACRSFSKISVVVSRILLKYRSYMDGPNVPPPEASWSAILVDKEKVEAVKSRIRALNLLLFLGEVARPTSDVLDVIDHFLSKGDDELKKAAVKCLFSIGLHQAKPEVIKRLKQLVLDPNAEFDYEDYRCEAIIALCRLDHQEADFLSRLAYFLRESSTFESYAVVAGLPYMRATEEVNNLYQLAVHSDNGAVHEEFIREIAISGRANQLTVLQDCLVQVLEKTGWNESRRQSLSAISSLDWLSERTRKSLIQIIYNRDEERWIRFGAAYCLKNYSTPELLDTARSALADSDPAIRYAGICLIASSGVLPLDFIEPLLNIAMGDIDEHVRSDAYEILAIHGYSNEGITVRLIESALSAEWDSKLRVNALNIVSRETIPPFLAEHLEKIVTDSIGRYQIDLDQDLRSSEEAWSKIIELGIHPSGDERITYNAALLLAQSGKWNRQIEGILRAALRYSGNRIRGQIYQDFGLGSPPSIHLIELLLDATSDETEVLVGIPSLYTTLDRIVLASPEGLLTVLDKCDNADVDETDKVGICCQIIGLTARQARLPLTPNILKRCFQTVAKAMGNSMFGYSWLEQSSNVKMHDRIYDALLEVAERCGEMTEDFNREVRYPWLPRSV